MQNIYNDVSFLDKRCVEKFGLSEDLMMEHAANALKEYIKEYVELGEIVFILCGPGNNGADGIAIARMLQGDYKVFIHLPIGAKSKMAKLQLERAKKANIKITTKLINAKCYVDALFGSGLNKPLGKKLSSLLEKINQKEGLKLACDVPSGIMQNGNVDTSVFRANSTITMGALKSSLFSDEAKEFLGTLHVKDLGISRGLYETKTDMFLLEEEDLNLPLRKDANVHKGNFGHLAVVSGEKKGAALFCADSAFCFGAGLVTLLGETNSPLAHLMSTKDTPKNITALACGMGLGKLDKKMKNFLLSLKIPMLLDADILTNKAIKKLLHVKKNLVITPHPKEFALMSNLIGFGDFGVKYVQANRLKLAKKFSLKYPCVLVLKGANTIIAHKGICYISTFGSQALAKGGSGDVLAGLIASLLAQKYSPLNAAISGVIAHSLAAKNFAHNSYALTPQEIIKEVKCL